MARTNVTDVKNIYDTDLTDPQLQSFIDDASLIVDNVLRGQGLSTATLTAIEKYLSAHLASVRDPLALRENIGDAGATFEARARSVGVGTRGLELTFYGQQAVAMDTTGRLKNAGKRRAFVKARGPWGDKSDD